MSKVFELVRKTASRVYRRSRKYEAEESHQLQDREIVKYSSSCYNLYQVDYYFLPSRYLDILIL